MCVHSLPDSWHLRNQSPVLISCFSPEWDFCTQRQSQIKATCEICHSATHHKSFCMFIKQVETHTDCKQMLKHTHTKASSICVQECACSCTCVIILGFSGGWREHLFTLTRIFLFCILHSCLLMVSTNRATRAHTHTHTATC